MKGRFVMSKELVMECMREFAQKHLGMQADRVHVKKVTLHKNGAVSLDLAPLEQTPVEAAASASSALASYNREE